MSKDYSGTNSFYAFQNSIADAWNLDDDDDCMKVSFPDIHSTAEAVIQQHKQGQLLDGSVYSNNNRKSDKVKQDSNKIDLTINFSDKMKISGNIIKPSDNCREAKVVISTTKKTAPGMGIRLTNCLHSIYPNVPENESEITDLDELRNQSWFGIPALFRPVTWKLLSDYVSPNLDKREERLKSKRTQYFRFLDQYYHQKDCSQNIDMYLQIQKDLQRMNTLHNKQHIQKLFERVLFIRSMRHPASGYVQGINDLVTRYFIVFLSEYVQVDLNTAGEITLNSEPNEDDFKKDHHTFAQPGIQTRVQALASLISRLDSELHQHLLEQKVEYLQFSFRWMNNLLMRELPLRCVIRLWDSYHESFMRF